MQTQAEALLREPVELASAIAMLALATLAWFHPQYLLLAPWAAMTLIGFLLFFAGIRSWQGFRVLRYRYLLRRLPRFTMQSHQIPKRTGHLYLGKGFLWQQRHAQRLRDSRISEIQSYVQPSPFIKTMWSVQIKLADYWPTRPLSKLLAWDVFFNPFTPPPPVGGNPILHGVGMLEGEHNIFLDEAQRNGHLIVFGKTRVGKTRLAEIILAQDIRAGKTVVVLDPKGDIDLMRRTITEAVRAGRPYYVLHLAHPEWSAAYNPIGSFTRITEIATRVTDQLPKEGQSAAFKEFGWRFSNIISQALVALKRKPNLDTLRSCFANIEPLFIDYAVNVYLRKQGIDWDRERTKIMQKIENKELDTFSIKEKSREAQYLLLFFEGNSEALNDHILGGLYTAVRYSKDFFSRIVASVGPLLDKLTTGHMKDILVPELTPNNKRPIIDWRRVIRENAVVYVGLDALSDSVVSSALGGAMLSDLTAVAGEIYNNDGAFGELPIEGERRRIAIHADEVNEIMQSQFVPLINKAGGAGFEVVAYTQTFSDIETKLGNRAKAEQVLGNFTNMIFFQIKDEVTAKILTEQAPKVEVKQAMMVTNVTDNSDPETSVDFQSSTQDRMTTKDIPAIDANDLLGLPKGQAVAVLGGGHLYKIRLPLPDNRDLLTREEIFSHLAQKMQRFNFQKRI